MTWQKHPTVHYILLLVLQLVIAGTAMSDDELDDLRRLYAERLAECKKAQAVLSDSESTEDQRTDATNTETECLFYLEQYKKAIENKGGKVPEPTGLKAKPGSPATGRHRARDAEGSVTKPVESHCDKYPLFNRPETSLYIFSKPGDLEGGRKRELVQALLDTESEYVKHLVICKDSWDFKSALAWDGTRSSFANRLRMLEEDFAWAFTGTHYSPEEMTILGEAYKERPELKELKREETVLYKEYIKYKTALDKLSRRYPLVPDPDSKAKLIAAVLNKREAEDAWYKVSQKITQIKGAEMDKVKEAKIARKLRGMENIKADYPRFVFEFHSLAELTATNSDAVKRLIGDNGRIILRSEGARRLKASEAYRH
jgi:hypothetical protein